MTPSWIRVGPESNDKCPYRKRRRTREKLCGDGADRGGMQLRVEEAWEPQKLEEARKHPPPGLVGARPANA